MHPDTELYLNELRNRLAIERCRAEGWWGPAASDLAKIWRAKVERNHAARVGAFLRSLRDWPQPGRPA